MNTALATSNLITSIRDKIVSGQELCGRASASHTSAVESVEQVGAWIDNLGPAVDEAQLDNDTWNSAEAGGTLCEGVDHAKGWVDYADHLLVHECDEAQGKADQILQEALEDTQQLPLDDKQTWLVRDALVAALNDGETASESRLNCSSDPLGFSRDYLSSAYLDAEEVAADSYGQDVSGAAADAGENLSTARGYVDEALALLGSGQSAYLSQDGHLKQAISLLEAMGAQQGEPSQP